MNFSRIKIVWSVKWSFGWSEGLMGQLLKCHVISIDSQERAQFLANRYAFLGRTHEDNC
jgi:hypothetical protein